MKYAESIREIPNAFNPAPLLDEDLERFYYAHTMEVRTGDKYYSPIEDIFDACLTPSERTAFLLLGHRGCGKSTELNEMSVRLRNEEGYPVKTIRCGEDLDLLNPAYADLFLLMGETLLEIANENHCKPSPADEKIIRDFWIDVERERILSNETGAEVEAGAKAKNTILDVPIFKLFANVKADLKYSEETRTRYREQIRKHLSTWISAMNGIADQIAGRLDGKRPVIIFEDLDKLGPDEAWKVFYSNAEKLTGVSFPVIYTFPIGLSYDPRFSALEGYFEVKIFPMIKVTGADEPPYDRTLPPASAETIGMETIRKIVQIRADLDLIDERALTVMIGMTGGSLRDLFQVINDSATRARRRRATKIQMEDVERALEKQKSSLTRRIERKHYDFLAKIYNGNRRNIEDRKMLLETLQAGVVLEYNGERWHNVHPLVAEYLREQGLTGNG